MPNAVLRLERLLNAIPPVKRYNLKGIRHAIRHGYHVVIKGKKGRILSIRPEDNSGKSWLVLMAIPVTVGFWFWKKTYYKIEEREQHIMSI